MHQFGRAKKGPIQYLSVAELWKQRWQNVYIIDRKAPVLVKIMHGKLEIGSDSILFS